MQLTRSRLAGLFLALLALFAGLWWLSWHDDTLARARTDAGLRIGYAVEPPYAFLTADGEVTGEAPEIVRHVAAQLGIKHIEWRQVEFGKLIDALETGQIDVIAAGMFITPEREERVRFSVPTLQVHPGLLVARGNPKRISSYREAAARDDVFIAVLAGAVEERILRQLGAPDERLVVVPDAPTGRQAIETGLADALLLSEPTVRWMAHQAELGQTESVETSFQAGEAEAYGRPAFAFRSDDQGLWEVWNVALQAYLHSPEHTALLARLGLVPEPKRERVPQGATPK